MPKILTSVFTKLLAILLIAVLGINLAIILFIAAFRHHVSDTFDIHLVRYIHYLIQDFGNPPDLERAKQIAEETAMLITYESPSLNWSTDKRKSLSCLEKVRHISKPQPHIQIGHSSGCHMINVKHADGQLTFYMPRKSKVDARIKAFGIFLLIGITLLMLGTYLSIRWVLKPLHWLKSGVDQVAKGELSHRVPLSRSDELRDLSQSFNTMTERLSQFIKAKERLLLDVSHELRSPLTRIKVALALLADNASKESISEDVNEMEAKIAELLDTARIIGVKAELRQAPTDLSELVRKIMAQFDHRAPGVRAKAWQKMPLISLDSEQMAKALKNIIDNGLKYSSPQSPPVDVTLRCQPPYALISVTDSGIGIPKEDLAFVFEPFYRVDRSRSPRTGGYGLGLSLAKTIVDAHGGCIEIESRPSHGTIVRIYLPL